MKFVSKYISIILIACIFSPVVAMAKEKEMQDINVHMATPVKINPNPVWEVGRSAWWGGVSGALLGGAYDILTEPDEGITGKSFAIGIIIGFGIGIYRISNADEKNARDAKGCTLNMIPTVRKEKIDGKNIYAYKWDLLQYNF